MRIDFKKEKRIVPFFSLGLVVLAKLSKGEVDFAHHHGTMPRQAAESSGLKLSV